MKYVLNGKEVTKEEFLAGKKWELNTPMTSNTYTEHDPWISESTGVLPSQVKAEREKLAKYQEKGLLTAVRIRDDGTVACTSRGEQGRVGWMQYRKQVDYDGGFGDTYTYDGKFGD